MEGRFAVILNGKKIGSRRTVPRASGLDALRLALLTDPGGLPVPTLEIKLLERDPRYPRIQW
jgi:hypothetical protein